jgi:hypothetical protein
MALLSRSADPRRMAIQLCASSLQNGVAFSGDVGVSFNLKAGLVGVVCNQAGT